MNGAPQRPIPPTPPPSGWLDLAVVVVSLLAVVVMFSPLWAIVHATAEIGQNVFGYAWEPAWWETMFIGIVLLPMLRGTARRWRGKR